MLTCTSPLAYDSVESPRFSALKKNTISYCWSSQSDASEVSDLSKNSSSSTLGSLSIRYWKCSVDVLLEWPNKSFAGVPRETEQLTAPVGGLKWTSKSEHDAGSPVSGRRLVEFQCRL